MNKTNTAKTETQARGRTAAIQVPIVKVENKGYVCRHIDIALNGIQADACRQVFDGLRENHVKLVGGKDINSAGDVVRYMLEQVAAGLR